MTLSLSLHTYVRYKKRKQIVTKISLDWKKNIVNNENSGSTFTSC